MNSLLRHGAARMRRRPKRARLLLLRGLFGLLEDYSQVVMLGSRYKPVNFRVKQSKLAWARENSPASASRSIWPLEPHQSGLFHPEVDVFVPRTQNDNLRIVFYCHGAVRVRGRSETARLLPLRRLFFFTLVTGPRRSLSLKLSDTRVYEP